MSDIGVTARRPSRTILVASYGLLALIIAFELVVTWLALHPKVSEDYRAYFIDKTTTCLNQPIAGDYVLGEKISFLPDGREAAMRVRVCGWDGPGGDGTHAVGERSRLRFVVAKPVHEATLNLTMIAIKRDERADQIVSVSINGQKLEDVTVPSTAPTSFSIPLPPALVLASEGRFEIFLDLPTAIRIGETDSNTRKRSIKLIAASLDGS